MDCHLLYFKAQFALFFFCTIGQTILYITFFLSKTQSPASLFNLIFYLDKRVIVTDKCLQLLLNPNIKIIADHAQQEPTKLQHREFL